MKNKNSNIKITDATVHGIDDGEKVELEEAVVEGVAKKVPQPSVPPNTTEQEDLTTAGQRQINLIWENTQSKIALFVVFVGILGNVLLILFLVIFGIEVSTNQLAVVTISLQFINLTSGIVIGFYFSRTNHQAIGGVGKKDDKNQEYKGR